MVQRRSKVSPRAPDPVKRPSSSMGPFDRFQGSISRNYLGSVICRGVGCASCCPGHSSLSLLHHFPLIAGPARLGRNQLMVGSGQTTVKAETTTCGAPTTTLTTSACVCGQIVVGERWSVWGASGEAVWMGFARAGQPPAANRRQSARGTSNWAQNGPDRAVRRAKSVRSVRRDGPNRQIWPVKVGADAGKRGL